MRLQEIAPLPDREPPEGGWKPVCRIEDHKWTLRCEAGLMHLECADPHTLDEMNEMEPNGCLPGCELGSENLEAQFGPFSLEWKQESHGWEYSNDYDTWAEVVENTVPVT